jgi:hypothetical protein
LEKEIDVLNGLEPILIFTFYKASAAVTASKIPIANDLGLNRLSLPPIPIYLSEKATGIYIDSEDKNLDIETNMEGLRTGDEPSVTQKPIGTTITVNMEANKDSLGLTLLSALCELLLPKLVSKEYGITYIHGPTIIFNGLLHSYSTSVDSNTDKMKIKLEISKDASKKASAIEVPKIPGLASLNEGTNVMSGGTGPAGAAFSAGGSAPIPIGGAP